MGGIFLSFFYHLSAINGLKFIVIGDKSKNDKNATYNINLMLNIYFFQYSFIHDLVLVSEYIC